MRSLAAEGRTVIVSSHLMSEMALTADHVIVIGLGRLIRDESMASFINSSSRGSVLVRSPDAARFAAVLAEAGATVSPIDELGPGALDVAGLGVERVGELAAEHLVVLHELTPRRASLEEAFIELTSDSVEFHASGKVA
jgi:ABC-2 type transport system ATP-binding protein